MSSILVRPAKPFDLHLSIPGDKSMSHRAIIFAGLADGVSRITGFLPSEDCLSTLRAMQALGVNAEKIDATTYIVEGRKLKLLAPTEPIDCGNSGTTMRLLSGVLAAQPFTSSLFGDASLSRRPMKRIADPLTRMGAKVVCEGADGRPPLEILGTALQAIDYQTPVPSAQLKSAVLLAGLGASGITSVTESELSRDHTERMLRHFNAAVERDGLTTRIHGGCGLIGSDFHVPGDFSSAAFWITCAAAMPGCRLKIDKLGLNPTRTGLIDVLIRMGAHIREHVDNPTTEPCGTLEIREGGHLHGTIIKGEEIPNVIDEIPIIAVAAALAEGTTTIRDAAELRVKESDRLAVVARNLKAFGVPVEELPDGLIIEGGHPIRAAEVTSEGDHRIAMSAAILALFADGISEIHDVDCIRTSYPDFPEHLRMAMGGQPGNFSRITELGFKQVKKSVTQLKKIKNKKTPPQSPDSSAEDPKKET